MSAALVKLNEVAQDRDEVVFGEDGRAGIGIEGQPLVDLVATDAAQVIALGREEQPFECLTSRLRVRRVARSQQRVDLS